MPRLHRRPTRRRPARPAVTHLHALEPRVLFHGVTIVTHGYEPFSNNRPSWIDGMGAAVAARAGAGTAVYTLRLEATNASTVHVSKFARLSGPESDASATGEAILLLDWAAVSGVLSNYYSTTYLASVIAPYLQQAYPTIGLNEPLAEGPVHLLGHSRGASLVASLAANLGKAGIWVDQVTTFDPVPVNADAPVRLANNVLFADNYYQKSGDGFLTPNGAPVAGAVNVGPLALGGAYGVLDGTTHSDVHLFYQGTIKNTGAASDGNHAVPLAWFSKNNISRTTSGFYYSRLGNGPRPAAGLSAAFGGAAARVAVTRTGDQWPNLALVKPSATSLEQGQPFSVAFKYQDADSAASVQWFFDVDRNPYNGNAVALDAASAVAASAAVATGSDAFTFAGLPGTYYLEGRITDGDHTRYAYAGSPLTVTGPIQKLVFTQSPANAVAGGTLSAVVQVQNGAGQLITDDTSSITLTLSGTAGGVLAGTVTAPVVNGVATFPTLSVAKAGTYTLTAANGSLFPVTSAKFTISPDVASARLYLVDQPDAAVVGQPLAPAISAAVQDAFGNAITTDKSKITLAVASGPANGALSGLTTVALKSGAATFGKLALSQAGTYVLTVSDADGSIATPLQFTQEVARATTTASKPPVAAKYAFGAAVSFTTAFKSDAPASVPFTGTATLLDADNHSLGTATLAANGQARFKLTGLAPGDYACTVVYPGDGNHTPVATPSFLLHVDPAPTQTTLQVSPASAVYGQALTLSAHLSSATAAGIARTGSITFKDGLTVLGTVPLDDDAAVLTVPAPAAGPHAYTAVYSGDANFQSGKSAVRNVTVKKDTAQVTLAVDAGDPVFPNDPVTFTATVTVLAPGVAPPTGTITFKEGAKTLGTAVLGPDGIAVLTVAFPSTGRHAVSAVYSGDALVGQAKSPLASVTVTA
jgi:hypothetical protein